MKVTQRKDSFRLIGEQKISWISIMIIVALSVMAYLGLNFASRSLEDSGNSFYRESRFRDLEISSTMLLTEEDIDRIRQCEGVKEVEGICKSEGFLSKRVGGADKREVEILSLTDNINKNTVKEGRLPEKEDECAMEEEIAGELGIKVGDEVSLASLEGEAPKYLKGKDYRVSALVTTAEHASTRDGSLPALIVKREAFDPESLGPYFMEALVLMEKPENISYFDRQYLEEVNKVTESLESLARERERLRTNEVKGSYQSKIGESEALLSTGGDQLLEAKKKLDQDRKELAESEKSLDKMKADLDAILKQYPEGSSIFEAIRPRYEESLSLYNKSLKEQEEKQAKYESSKKDYDEKLKEYYRGKTNLEDSKKELSEIGSCRWLLLGPKGNPSYAYTYSSVNNIRELGTAFAIIFILLGALVTIVTTGRMVSEQRKALGLLKTLGLYKREMLLKYVTFSLSATLSGILLGFFGGTYFLQRLLLKIYGSFFIYDTSGLKIDPLLTVLVVTGEILLSFLTVFFSCFGLLKKKAEKLMEDRLPSYRHKRKGGEQGSSLYFKLIFYNIMSALKKTLITIISIGGVTAVLVAGFTMKGSVSKTLKYHYKDIIAYDYQLDHQMADDKTLFEKIQEIAGKDSIKCDGFYDKERYINVKGEMIKAELICGSLTKLDSYILRIDHKSGKEISGDIDPSGEYCEGIWIYSRLAESKGLNKGDEFLLYDDQLNPYAVKVAGVFENYFGSRLIMSDDYYKKVFGQAPRNNTIFIKSGLELEGEKLMALLGLDGVSQVKSEGKSYDFGKRSIDIFGNIALVMVAVAAVMSYLILQNLINIHMGQKKRELTLMAINGFYTKELKLYGSGEFLVNSALGMLLGLFLGSFLGRYMIGLMESESMEFVKNIRPEAWFFSVLIIFIFILLALLVGMKDIKKLDLKSLTGE
ncbi:MAG: hypothetical protein K5931_01350 [Lachnospiraceae bacterium]|nr:hypothetical protein [Lachnospiraceae bacterium]